jgi:tRNA (cytidine56-2'-O)-methyltransferase
MPRVTVLRLGHRPLRDKRITTHCGLVARAFGAEKIIIAGEKDEKVLESIEKVVEKWGGPFQVVFTKDFKKEILKAKKKKTTILLTMYGQPIQKIIKEIRKKKEILVIIGAEKVPGEVYKIVDYNIAIGNTPHSEVAALAIFLDKLFQGKELEKNFKNAKVKIVPQKKGKKLVKKLNK